MVDRSESNALSEGGGIAFDGRVSGTAAKLAPQAQSVSSSLSSEWDYCTVKAIADGLQRRRISALELTDHTIARIQALDIRLNAVVVRDFERARETAKVADIALAGGDRRPLLGVPVTFKEAFNITGLPTTWGFPQFKNFIPREDALIVSRVKAAGAVVLGKTNVPVALADFQAYNDVYGTTNNPWDLERSPGGSSGGSAAALAAGFGPLSFGSDIGGSLRVPAHFCGVYAHKPTLGLVPVRGYSPPPPFSPVLDDGALAVIGPMARTAADLNLALNVIAGPDGDGGGKGYRLSLPAARHNKLSDFRVLLIGTHPLMPTDSAVHSTFDRLSMRLSKAGVKVAHANELLPSLAESARLYMTLLASAKSVDTPIHLYKELQRSAAVLSPDDITLGSARTRGAVMSHRDWLAADVARAQLRHRWNSLFREFDVVLYPPASVPAFPHDHSLPIAARQIEIDGKNYPFYDACFVWADPATTCGLPATAAPIDLSPGGLPVGVQIVGPYLEDRTTIAFAELLEREFGGFVPPPGYGVAT
jgi:amidase